MQVTRKLPEQSAVKAALDKLRAAHDSRHAAMARALAEELGLDADKVAAALEANRPQKR